MGRPSAIQVRLHVCGSSIERVTVRGRAVRTFQGEIELYCLPELIRFYEPFGFTADFAGLRFLRKTRPPG